MQLALFVLSQRENKTEKDKEGTWSARAHVGSQPRPRGHDEKIRKNRKKEVLFSSASIGVISHNGIIKMERKMRKLAPPQVEREVSSTAKVGRGLLLQQNLPNFHVCGCEPLTVFLSPTNFMASLSASASKITSNNSSTTRESDCLSFLYSYPVFGLLVSACLYEDLNGCDVAVSRGQNQRRG